MATSLRLLTIADGFGDSRAVPAWYPDYIKWPEIIRWMTRDIELCNLSSGRRAARRAGPPGGPQIGRRPRPASP